MKFKKTYNEFLFRFEEIFITCALEFQNLSKILGKILLIVDNSPAHPPLEELNGINENVEVLYLPPNVTALIQLMDQGAISITKKYYKKNLLRRLLFADQIEGADTFLKNFNLRDCFPLLKNAWSTLQDSTLNKIWKPIFGNSCLLNEINSDSLESIHENAEHIM